MRPVSATTACSCVWWATRLATFREPGFSDPGGRLIGDRRPQVALLLEKNSLGGDARQLVERFGFTVLISGGSTKLIDAEFLALELAQRGIFEVELLALVDYDPAGWDLAEGFVPQLERYNLRVRGKVVMVVTAECFTQREIRLHAYPCPTSTPALATQTRRWLEKCGGIHGQAFGIGADHFRPLERIVERLEALGW